MLHRLDLENLEEEEIFLGAMDLIVQLIYNDCFKYQELMMPVDMHDTMERTLIMVRRTFKMKFDYDEVFEDEVFETIQNIVKPYSFIDLTIRKYASKCQVVIMLNESFMRLINELNPKFMGLLKAHSPG